MARKFEFFGSYTSFAFEAETIAYMNAIGIANDSTIYYSGTPQQITGNALWLAVNDFVISIKSIGLSKFKYVYPRIGGTASRHAINLVNPANLDSAFRGTYFGGWIHNELGQIVNGVNTYMRTHFIPSVNGLAYNDSHICLATTVNNPSIYDHGSGASTGENNFGISTRRTTDVALFDSGNFAINRNSQTNIDGKGVYIGSATSDNNSRLYKDGTLLGVKSLTSSSISNIEVYDGAFNEVNLSASSQLIYYSKKSSRFTSVGLGLTSIEVGMLNTAVQNLQTALNRAV